MMRRQNFNKKHITRRNLDGQLQHTYTRIHLYTYTQPQSVHRSICGLLGKAVHFLEINTSAPQKGTEQLENLCQHHLKGLLSTPSLSQTPTKHKLSTVKPFIYSAPINAAEYIAPDICSMVYPKKYSFLSVFFFIIIFTNLC